MPRKVKVVNIFTTTPPMVMLPKQVLKMKKQKTNQTKKPKQKRWWSLNQPSLKHEQNECQNLKLSLLMWQLSLSPQQSKWHPNHENSEPLRRKWLNYLPWWKSQLKTEGSEETKS